MTIEEIHTSDKFDENEELFIKGMDILYKKIQNRNFDEFTDEEREVLEEVYSKMEE